MDRLSLSANLRRLRISSGKSQAEIAETAELSRFGYRAIETGAVVPRVDSLSRIAQALGVGVDDLLAPAHRFKAVRFRAQKKMTTREQLLVEVAGWLADYNEIERLREIEAKYPLGTTMKKAASMTPGEERAKATAGLARQAVGLAEDGHEDVVRDMCGLLEGNGVKVITPKVASEGFFGLSVAKDDGGPAVVVNAWERVPVERRIFTAAHELGHLILHLESFDVTQTQENKAEEKEADVFASYFLMPDRLFDQAWDEARGLPLVPRVLKVKRIFRVSYKAVLYRVQSTRGVKNIWVRFQSEYKSVAGTTLGGKDEPERLREADFVTDRLNRLVREAYEAGQIGIERAAYILGKDVEAMERHVRSWM